jgi:hypothetical protein
MAADRTTVDTPFKSAKGRRLRLHSRSEEDCEEEREEEEGREPGLYLTTTVSSFKPPATAPSRVGFDPEADFNFNSELRKSVQ